MSELGFSIKGRRVILRPLLPQDLETIFAWRSNLEDLHLWSSRMDVLPFELFTEDFRGHIRGFVHIIMMIQSRFSTAPIGMVYSYKPDLINGHLFGLTYVDPNHRHSFYCAEACLLFIDYLFSYYPIRKVYGELFEYNNDSLSALLNSGFVEEGRLKNHRWYRDSYRDMLILALYRETFYERNARTLALIRKLRDANATDC